MTSGSRSRLAAFHLRLFDSWPHHWDGPETISAIKMNTQKSNLVVYSSCDVETARGDNELEDDLRRCVCVYRYGYVGWTKGTAWHAPTAFAIGTQAHSAYDRHDCSHPFTHIYESHPNAGTQRTDVKIKTNKWLLLLFTACTGKFNREPCAARSNRQWNANWARAIENTTRKGGVYQWNEFRCGCCGRRVVRSLSLPHSLCFVVLRAEDTCESKTSSRCHTSICTPF